MHHETRIQPDSRRVHTPVMGGMIFNRPTHSFANFAINTIGFILL